MSGSAKFLLILLTFLLLLFVSVLFLCIEPLVSAISFSLLLVVTLAFFVWASNDTAKERAADIKLDKFGTVVKGWLVFGNEALFRQLPPKASYPALFVFSMDERIPNPDREMPILAKDLQGFRASSSSFDEVEMEKLIRTGSGASVPLRVPSRITGKLEVFFATIWVKAEMLPENSLTKKYIYCKFYKGEHREESIVRMIPYPVAEQRSDRERKRTRDNDWDDDDDDDRGKKKKWEDDPWDD